MALSEGDVPVSGCMLCGVVLGNLRVYRREEAVRGGGSCLIKALGLKVTLFRLLWDELTAGPVVSVLYPLMEV